MTEEALSTLNDLIHLDIDAIHAYRQALEACDLPEVRHTLTAFMGDHERHVTELQAAVRALGGEPVGTRDLKGFFIEGFTAIVSRGDRTALLAMRGNEELTTRRYEAALEANVMAEANQVIRKNHADEVRHLAWIKGAIDRKVWERPHGKAA
jgi:uncharacterized protein (TIGR02284 family)